MKLWILPDAEHPTRIVNLESLLGLEVRKHDSDWRLVGILNGSFVLLHEGTEAEVREKLSEGIAILTGWSAPAGVSWRGPGDA